MALKSTIRKAVKQAFLALDDIPVQATYRKVGDGETVIDIETGAASLAYTSYTLPLVVITRFRQKETDKDPTLLTDQKMLFPREDLPVEPATDDEVYDSRGRRWQVIEQYTDPAELLGIIRVRAA